MEAALTPQLGTRPISLKIVMVRTHRAVPFLEDSLSEVQWRQVADQLKAQGRKQGAPLPSSLSRLTPRALHAGAGGARSRAIGIGYPRTSVATL